MQWNYCSFSYLRWAKSSKFLFSKAIQYGFVENEWRLYWIDKSYTCLSALKEQIKRIFLSIERKWNEFLSLDKLNWMKKFKFYFYFYKCKYFFWRFCSICLYHLKLECCKTSVNKIPVCTGVRQNQQLALQLAEMQHYKLQVRIFHHQHMNKFEMSVYAVVHTHAGGGFAKNTNNTYFIVTLGWVHVMNAIF